MRGTAAKNSPLLLAWGMFSLGLTEGVPINGYPHIRQASVRVISGFWLSVAKISDFGERPLLARGENSFVVCRGSGHL